MRPGPGGEGVGGEGVGGEGVGGEGVGDEGLEPHRPISQPLDLTTRAAPTPLALDLKGEDVWGKSGPVNGGVGYVCRRVGWMGCI